MALIVHKYGGTSMGSPERIQSVAKRVAKWARAGHRMVVVPSAMSGETNRLLALAKQVSPERSTPELMRELDMIASTGEQVSVGLLSIALQAEGLPAVSYAGWQVPIATDVAYTKARIRSIDDKRIRADLDAGKVVVVTGFQGVDPDGHITTLGRGGSDTSAVAVAAALKADECLIYTDVDGVYTTDPRIVADARGSRASASRRCSRWRASARRCCRSARSSSPASTGCRSGCSRASRPGTSRSTRKRARARSSHSRKTRKWNKRSYRASPSIATRPRSA
jgi:aspartate kinase